jgi:hypothetical protein
VGAAVAAGLFCVAVPNPLTVGHDLSAAHLRLSSLAEVGWSDLVAAHRAVVDAPPTRGPLPTAPA